MLKVAGNPCDQCLFSKDKIVSKERMVMIVEECKKDDKHFLCHKGTIANTEIVCHGWYTKYSSFGIRLAKALNFIKLINPNNYGTRSKTP